MKRRSVSCAHATRALSARTEKEEEKEEGERQRPRKMAGNEKKTRLLNNSSSLFSTLFLLSFPRKAFRPSALCTPMIYTRKIHLRKLWPTLVAIAQRPDPIVNLATERASGACAASGLSVIVLMAK